MDENNGVPTKDIPELDWLAWCVLYERDMNVPYPHEAAMRIAWNEQFCDHCPDRLSEFEQGRIYGEFSERFLGSLNLAGSIGKKLVDWDAIEDPDALAVNRRVEIAEEAAQRDIDRSVEQWDADPDALAVNRRADLSEKYRDHINIPVEELVDDAREAMAGLDEEEAACLEVDDIWDFDD